MRRAVLAAARRSLGRARPCRTLATILALAGLGAATVLPARVLAAAGDTMAPPSVRAEAQAPAASQPAALRQVAIEQRLGEQVPLDLAFRDEAGRAVTLGDYFGKRPVVLALAYYECPMLCTLVLNGMVRAFRALAFDVGDEFEVLTVSFDPTETPALAAAKKATYLEHYDRKGAAEGWHFLTGEGPAIERLAHAVGFQYTWLPDQQQFAHAAAIMVLTPDGKLARYFYGVEYPPRDLRLGLVEAAAGTIGSPVDQVLLYCFQYDPATGTYAAVTLNLVRLGGIATVLALGGFVLLSRRRDRAAAGATPRGRTHGGGEGEA